MDNVAISVIVPVYNVEKYLKECLDSIVNQTLKNIEILCVNDGSTDNSLQILESYAEKDNRVIIINKENGGYASAINAGLDVAKGTFVQIVESDDYCDLGMCEELFNKIKDSDADLVTADFATLKPTLFGNRLKIYKYFNTNIEYYNLKDFPEVASKPSYPWKSLYRNAFLRKNNIRMFQDGVGAYEDLPWNATVLSMAKKILYVPKSYYRYRLFAEGSSTNSGKKSMINYIKRRAQIRDIFIKYKVFSDDLKEYYWAGALNGCLFFLKKIGIDYKDDFYFAMKSFLSGAKEDAINFIHFNKKMRRRYKNIMKYDYSGYIASESCLLTNLIKGFKRSL